MFRVTISSPGSRMGHSGVIISDRMLIFAGISSSYTLLQDLYSYSFDNMTWEVINSPGAPSPRTFHAAGVMGDTMYIFGGYNLDYLGDIYSFNYTTGVWNEINAVGSDGVLPSGRRSSTMVVVGE